LSAICFSLYSADGEAPKIEPIRQASLFEMEEFERAADSVEKLERPFCEPSLFLGTSAFTAAGWPGTFYPEGMKSQDYHTYYASKFKRQLRSTAIVKCNKAFRSGIAFPLDLMQHRRKHPCFPIF
jgi:hypothetical protein